MESIPSMNFSSYYFLFGFRFRSHIRLPLAPSPSFPSPIAIAIVANASTQDLENVADNEAAEWSDPEQPAAFHDGDSPSLSHSYSHGARPKHSHALTAHTGCPATYNASSLESSAAHNAPAEC